MIHADELKAMTREQKISYAKSIGLNIHHKTGDDKLDFAIIEHIANQEQKPQVVQEKPKAVLSDELTPDALDELLKDMVFDGLRVRYLDDGKTWNFKFGNKEDTGSMTIPKNIIIRKAEYVMQRSGTPRDLNILPYSKG